MRLIFTLTALFLTSISFSQDDCIDPDIIDQDVFCPGIYDPVCGCDGVTYSNSCVAESHNGVTEWVDGECSGVDECTDLEGVDFGLCEMLLGYGLVNGQCQSISGCGTTADDGVDYENAIHDSPEECAAICGSGVEECTDLAGVDFGPCDLFLGYAIVDGTCQGISGCSTVGDDEVDYANAIHGSPEECAATCGDGVEECTDLAGVDFGDCEAELGYGLVNGQCQSISGCSTVGDDGIDYANALHSTSSACQVLCGDTSGCVDLSEVDFGACAMPLGIIWNGSYCEAISGCDYIGDDGVDYSDYFYQDIEDCAGCAEDCINPDQVDAEHPCTEEYDPVCGCDSVTYSNDCHAYFYGGVTSWTDGECTGVDECTDLAGVDFGPCDLFLGYAIVDGTCQGISGCSTVGDDEVDYANAIHGSPEECAATCGDGVEECTDLAGVDFGDCDAVLGYGLVNGECQTISGCSTVGDDDIDYANAIHSTPSACQVQCGDATGCIDLSQVDFGDCAMPLGFIWNGSYCETVSGCDYVGDDGVDYSNYFYDFIQDCAACSDECSNPGQIDDAYPCTEEYDPVCGCDSVTYSNECYAYYYGGITEWESGECGTVGVGENESSSIQLYPTLFTDVVKIKGRIDGSSELKIYSAVGRLVFEKTIQSETDQIRIGHLSTGMYHYSIVFDGGVLATGKLIKSQD